MMSNVKPPWQVDGRPALRDALEQAVGASTPTSLLVVDIDHMLWFNDSFDHETGDLLLRRIWHCLDQVADGEVFRTGGDVFSVLLVQVDAREARLRASELRGAVEALRIENPRPNAGDGCVTVSIGGATHSAATPHTAEQLIAQATERCYQAKVRGRNCVVLSDPTA
jgi:diguanylate cyclase (GGDEF)-like protein